MCAEQPSIRLFRNYLRAPMQLHPAKIQRNRRRPPQAQSTSLTKPFKDSLWLFR